MPTKDFEELAIEWDAAMETCLRRILHITCRTVGCLACRVTANVTAPAATPASSDA